MGRVVSNVIDLYIEKLLAKMVVDDDQRAAIEREIRSHLEEAAAAAVEKGLTPEQAEREAVLAFGQPSVVARQFGFWRGAGWLLFERAAFAVLVYLVVWRLLDWWPVATVMMIVMFATLWKRIELKNGLVIHRPFRRQLRIPFDSIENIKLERAHLLGFRRIIVRFSGGRVRLSFRMRGMRAAGLALTIFAGDRVDEGVWRYVSRLKLRIRREAPAFKIAMSVIWIAIAWTAAAGLPWLWPGYGIRPVLVIACIASIIVLVFQALLHCDRSKVGLCWLLVIPTAVAILAMVAGLFLALPDAARTGFLIFNAVIVSALLTVWWRGKRLILVICTLALCVGALEIGRRFAPHTRLRITGISRLPGPVTKARWFDDSRGLMWIAGHKRAAVLRNARAAEPSANQTSMMGVLHVLRFDEQETTYPLEGDFFEWDFAFQPHSDELLLIREWSADLLAMRSKFYRFQPGQSVEPTFGPLPVATWYSRFASRGTATFSPDGRRICALLLKNGDDSSSGNFPAVVRLDTGEVTPLPDLPYNLFVRWTGNTELVGVELLERYPEAAAAGDQESMSFVRNPSERAVIRAAGEAVNQAKDGEGISGALDTAIHLLEQRKAAARSRPDLKNRLVIRTFNLETGQTTVTGEYKLDADEGRRILSGGEYGLIIREKPEAAPPSIVFSIFNFTTGKRVSLPDWDTEFAFERSYCDWNPEHRKFVYPAVPEKSGGPTRLVFADADKGMEKTLSIPAGFEFQGFRLSPNCRHVAFYRRPRGGSSFNRFWRLEIWNIEAGQIVPVRAMGMLGTVAVRFDMSEPNRLPLWSPDSRHLAYDFVSPGPERYEQIELADWGAWLERGKAE